MDADPDRPDPDALLARVQRDEEAAKRGRLKVFLGAAAGVGKTYAMLLAAREQQVDKVDVVVGVVETHRRRETEALLEGLEVLARREVPYRGVALHEFDLDSALARKPRLIIVDELAHSNAPGSRHAKRWQDVEELLDAGIDVYTAMNVQHIESLNDVVGQITSVRVWETVPDHVFDEADEVELVDLPPDELLERLAEGKVYMPEAAESAIRNFFRKGNLMALRELALRRTADRVEAQMQRYRADHAIQALWPVAERVIVAVGAGPHAERVIRAGRRVASRLGAPWTAVYVETPRLQRLPPEERDRILRNLRLAEALGGESVTLGGGDAAAEIAAYARTKNASRVVVGRESRTGWRRLLPLSVADRILDLASGIEVLVVTGDANEEAQPATRALIARTRAHLGVHDAPKRRWPRYLWGVAVVVVSSGLAALMEPYFELANLVMVYLVGVVLVAARFGRGPSIVASVLGVLAFDFLFVPPYFSFAVSDTEYIVTFAVMLAVGLVISNLAAALRTQARIAGYREQRTAALYAMSRELAAIEERDRMLPVAVRHLAEVFDSQVALLFPDRKGRLASPSGRTEPGSLRGTDLAVAQWVFDHGERAGLGTDTLPSAEAHYIPLPGANGPIGVVAILPANPRRVFIPEQQRLLDTFASQIALALERAQLAAEARASQLAAESERVRNALLSAISHDLRTPLASIVGAASALEERETRVDAAGRVDLARTIRDEAVRMSGLVDNVLSMARLESGRVELRREWQPVEEIVGGVLTRLARQLAGHRVEVHVPPELPMVHVDGVLLGQVLENLLLNAAKFAPPGSHVSVAARRIPDEIEVTVSDEGPGLPPGEEQRVFEKFHRARAEPVQSGVGLGLAIAKAIVELHGGSISAETLPAGGAVFRFSIPLGAAPVAAAEAAA
jgi:two-component system, OmpR family, sensor histidine kinase KdpD